MSRPRPTGRVVALAVLAAMASTVDAGSAVAWLQGGDTDAPSPTPRRDGRARASAGELDDLRARIECDVGAPLGLGGLRPRAALRAAALLAGGGAGGAAASEAARRAAAARDEGPEALLDDDALLMAVGCCGVAGLGGGFGAGALAGAAARCVFARSFAAVASPIRWLVKQR